MIPARWATIHGQPEFTELTAGMDFRQPVYRREVFRRFYLYHTKFKAHPGGVYYLIPWLRRHFQMEDEEAFWWCFLNGNTQHPVTTTFLWERFPNVRLTQPTEVHEFLQQHWKQLEFDADRRYWKIQLPEAIRRYKQMLGGRTQADYFAGVIDDVAGLDQSKWWDALWTHVRIHFYGFGRLSAWSYLEYLKILKPQFPVPDDLMLRDRDGSKSHRNGLCKVLGRDDLDWHQSNPTFDGRYDPDVLNWLDAEGLNLLNEIRLSAPQDLLPDLNYFTLESTFCCYKSWHRPNRRYPNIYNDMLHDRIKRAEQAWGKPGKTITDLFWQARNEALPAGLRLEDNPCDPGLVPEKQNHYRLTGQIIMMDPWCTGGDHGWMAFKNDFNDRIRLAQGGDF